MALPFNPYIAIGVVVSTGILDALHASYTRSVTGGRPLAAAGVGSLTYLVSAFSVIQYTNDPIYIGFMMVGSFIGSYIFVSRTKSAEIQHVAQ